MQTTDTIPRYNLMLKTLRLWAEIDREAAEDAARTFLEKGDERSDEGEMLDRT